MLNASHTFEIVGAAIASGSPRLEPFPVCAMAEVEVLGDSFCVGPVFCTVVSPLKRIPYVCNSIIDINDFGEPNAVTIHEK